MIHGDAHHREQDEVLDACRLSRLDQGPIALPVDRLRVGASLSVEPMGSRDHTTGPLDGTSHAFGVTQVTPKELDALRRSPTRIPGEDPNLLAAPRESLNQATAHSSGSADNQDHQGLPTSCVTEAPTFWPAASIGSI
jgi:hypothetical protein